MRTPFRLSIIIAVILSILFFAIFNKGNDDEQEHHYYSVKNAPLTITITEAGNIENRDEITIKNETKRDLRIVSILEEGTIVTNGQLVIELESDNLMAERDAAELNLHKNTAQLEGGLADVEALKSQLQTSIDKARHDLNEQRRDFEKYSKGIHPNSLESAESSITLAKANLERAQKDYEWSEKLFKMGYITEKELKADELTAQEKSSTYNIKTIERDLKTKYTHPQEIATIEANIKHGQTSVERTKGTMRARLAGKNAQMLHFKASVKRATKELTKAEKSLTACRMCAPADGMVIYATSGKHAKHHRGAQSGPLKVGSTVYPGQGLIRMSTSNVMIAQLDVQEATKPKIKLGLSTTVIVDAIPGKVYKGTVSHIDILPDAQQAWLNPDLKVYICEIKLDGQDIQLRPGMNCKAIIELEKHEKAIFVPLRCVEWIDDKPTVLLKRFGGYKKRVVKTGMDDGINIHILEGLKKGNKVLLDPYEALREM